MKKHDLACSACGDMPATAYEDMPDRILCGGCHAELAFGKTPRVTDGKDYSGYWHPHYRLEDDDRALNIVEGRDE